MMYRRILGPWGRTYALALAAALVGAVGTADGASTRKGVAAARKAAAPPAKGTVKVVSIPIAEECPADDEAAKAGFRAFLDPETGELRAPTPEEEAAFSRLIASQTVLRAEPAQKVSVGPNGELIYFLGEEGMVDMIAHTDADGKTVVSCVSHPETGKTLARPAPKKSAGAKEEK
jgi:hypothetical protein